MINMQINPIFLLLANCIKSHHKRGDSTMWAKLVYTNKNGKKRDEFINLQALTLQYDTNEGFGIWSYNQGFGDSQVYKAILDIYIETKIDKFVAYRIKESLAKYSKYITINIIEIPMN